MSARRVVIVEDDVLIAFFFADICRSIGFDVVAIEHEAEAALARLLEVQPEFVLMDVRLGGKRDGIEVAIAAHEAQPDLKVIYITGSNEPPSLKRLRADHPYKILIKPILPSDIIEALTSVA